MNYYCHLPGVDCTPQTFQVFMMVLVAWSALSIIAGLGISAYRRDIYLMPTWLKLVCILKILAATPIGFAIQFVIWISFYEMASLSASLVTTAFGLYGFWTFWYFTIGPLDANKTTQSLASPHRSTRSRAQEE